MDSEKKEIDRLKKIIKAKDMLLVAYRLQIRRAATKAIDLLDEIEKEGKGADDDKRKNKKNIGNKTL